jgi:hypothetical protein
MHRRNLESLAARLAHDLVVHPDQVVAELCELRPIALVGAGRQAIFFRPPYPAHRIFIRASATRATEPLVAIFVFIEEEGAFV